ncbi:MAG: hypothetical protein ACLSVO_05185 [Alistipes sp.]|uniref:hypothetical protein n=1 Tax=Alistipes sp. TaxID=1872444 RepID=UPI0039965788
MEKRYAMWAHEAETPQDIGRANTIQVDNSVWIFAFLCLLISGDGFETNDENETIANE